MAAPDGPSGARAQLRFARRRLRDVAMERSRPGRRQHRDERHTTQWLSRRALEDAKLNSTWERDTKDHWRRRSGDLACRPSCSMSARTKSCSTMRSIRGPVVEIRL